MTKQKILIVEDEWITAESLKNCLEKLEFGISGIVSSGKEAIENVKSNAPDLVLMDIMLKGDMNGIEAADIIYGELKVPVVYLTAFDDDKMLKKAKVTEPFGYILKPFGDRELNTTITIALYKHKIERRKQKICKHLQVALDNVKPLEGIVSICCVCKNIRNNDNHWESIDKYMSDHLNVQFTHGYCPDCAKEAIDDFDEFLDS